MLLGFTAFLFHFKPVLQFHSFILVVRERERLGYFLHAISALFFTWHPSKEKKTATIIFWQAIYVYMHCSFSHWGLTDRGWFLPLLLLMLAAFSMGLLLGRSWGLIKCLQRHTLARWKGGILRMWPSQSLLDDGVGCDRGGDTQSRKKGHGHSCGNPASVKPVVWMWPEGLGADSWVIGSAASLTREGVPLDWGGWRVRSRSEFLPWFPE